ncbi:MAG TPA: triose-phosphate isomerase [Halanaerobiales bacterium]|nr:triose-phosphate isomerase [Halanaerobiales bacterium]
MRKPFIAGNWKMNKTISEAKDLVSSLKEKVADIENVEVGVCPPAIDLQAVKKVAAGSNVKVGAQNMHWEESGAFTGDISPVMIKELGLEYIIIGHSERREYYNETDEQVNKKVHAAFEHGIKPIICVGESLEERKANETRDKVEKQVKAALKGLNQKQVSQTVIAYEPIWAIGTGESATAKQANQVISYIRDVIEEEYLDAADDVRIQYGGSVKPYNIEEFMAESDIDGALVGGASLEAESFAAIVRKTSEM